MWKSLCMFCVTGSWKLCHAVIGDCFKWPHCIQLLPWLTWGLSNWYILWKNIVWDIIFSSVLQLWSQNSLSCDYNQYIRQQMSVYDKLLCFCKPCMSPSYARSHATWCLLCFCSLYWKCLCCMYLCLCDENMCVYCFQHWKVTVIITAMEVRWKNLILQCLAVMLLHGIVTIPLMIQEVQCMCHKFDCGILFYRTCDINPLG